MTSLPLTKNNLKKFMNAYSHKMESKKQTPSEVSFATTARSNASGRSRGGKRRGFGNKKTRVNHRKMRALVQSTRPVLLRRALLRNKLKLVKEGYFADIKDSKEDPKLIQNELDLLEKEIQMVKAALAEAYRGRSMNIKVWFTAAASSSSNAAYNTVIPLDPNSSAEFSSLSGLFDLCLCSGADIHTAVYILSGVTANTLTWGAAYDPLSSGVYTSVVALLPAAYRVGPIRIGSMGASGASFAISAVQDMTTTKTGFHTWKVHIPEEPTMSIQSSSSGTGICTGEWVDTSFGTMINGYIKPYVPAAGSGNVTQIEQFIGLHMRFKMRS